VFFCKPRSVWLKKVLHGTVVAASCKDKCESVNQFDAKDGIIEGGKAELYNLLCLVWEVILGAKEVLGRFFLSNNNNGTD